MPMWSDIPYRNRMRSESLPKICQTRQRGHRDVKPANEPVVVGLRWWWVNLLERDRKLRHECTRCGAELAPTDHTNRCEDCRRKQNRWSRESMARIRGARRAIARYARCMKIRPLHDHVVLKRANPEKSKGGIIIPEPAQEKSLRCEVVAVGPGKLTDAGTLVPPGVAKGETVLIGSKYVGQEIEIENEKYLLVRAGDIAFVLDHA